MSLSVGTPENITNNPAELKFLNHLRKLHHRLQAMEEHKRMKPFFSQAADRLNDRITQLLGMEEHALDATSSTRLGRIAIGPVDESTEFPKLPKQDRLLATNNSSGDHAAETHDYGKRVQSHDPENLQTQEYYSRVRAVNLSHSPTLDAAKATPNSVGSYRPKDEKGGEYDSSTSPMRSSYNRRRQLVSTAT